METGAFSSMQPVNSAITAIAIIATNPTTFFLFNNFFASKSFYSCMSKLNTIQRCFSGGKVLYTKHARDEMRTEPFGKIREEEVFEAVMTGEIIERYENDKPYPSVLIYGKT